MKVLCVDSKTRVLPIDLIEGQVYEVTEGSYCHAGCCYDIPELHTAAHKDRFIPLSEIDEMELVNENSLVAQQ